MRDVEAVDVAVAREAEIGDFDAVRLEDPGGVRPHEESVAVEQRIRSVVVVMHAALQGVAGEDEVLAVVVRDEDVLIELPGATLQGYLHIPENAVGVVAFAHGTGSSRHSPRNQRVAAALNHHRIGTLLLDLLTEDEERLDAIDRHLAFDIGFLSERMVGIVNWLMADVRTSKLPVGLFGASTGAAAALSAAVELKDAICAVVSRGGRPDLAADALYEVQVATLLIVGELDDVVIDLNKSALERIPCTDKKLIIVPGATHLFEEHGTLDQVVDYTVEWFSTHFVASRVQRISVR